MRRVSAILVLAGTLALAGSAASEPGLEARKAEARAVTETLFEVLSRELKAALEEGGPPAAIRVCRDRAPELKRDLSLEKGWKVTRVGTRTRNALLGLPDPWEQEVLERFAARRAAGAGFAELEHAEVVAAPFGEEFRYMRAIGVQEPCLACHGARDELPGAIREGLAEHYPHDRATGYREGDLRGAFSIRYRLE